MHWRRKWQPTPGFLPGESQEQGSLVGCRLWGHTESDTTEVTWQRQQWISLGLHPRLDVLLRMCDLVRWNDGGPGERRTARAPPGGMSATSLDLLGLVGAGRVGVSVSVSVRACARAQSLS